MSDRANPSGLKALFDVLVAGVSPLTSGTLKAMILNASSSVVADWDAADTLDDITTPAEYVEASYSRLTVTCTVAIDADEMVLDFTDLLWASLAAGANSPEFIVLYVEKTGAAADPAFTDRVPILLLDAVFTPDGTNYTYVIPSQGIYRIPTA